MLKFSPNKPIINSTNLNKMLKEIRIPNTQYRFDVTSAQITLSRADKDLITYGFNVNPYWCIAHLKLPLSIIFNGKVDAKENGAAELGLMNIIEGPVNLKLEVKYSDCWADYNASRTTEINFELTEDVYNTIDADGTLELDLCGSTLKLPSPKQEKNKPK